MGIMDELGLSWDVEPESWSEADGVLGVYAAGQTDIFASPFGDVVKGSAARALTGAAGAQWQLAARVRVGFGGDWDAGGLLVWSDAGCWAKLTYEQGTDGRPAVFSVVTRDGRSDDAVGWPLGGDGLWLRISALDGGYAFHAGADGQTWQLVRQFALGETGPVRVGLVAQSPVGTGCAVHFDQVTLAPTRLAHLFDGR
ncbi:DUF1349 domain-containing protein [Catellatospora sp. KI3]|uniref:DUF1349 domain-containing protein n=1 Tax=Catellatospora sp. KI3 TaxID=3041620 RepID=UPI002482A2DE|nr:DUF1349 domain-containing protein [Catellatospora sp. KI3]MDI1461417.1 DUF1349 domain-containing protein [Catellatospora sp. KI3]